MNLKDNSDQTPIDWCGECARPGQKECLTILREAGGKASSELSENNVEEEEEEEGSVAASDAEQLDDDE